LEFELKFLATAHHKLPTIGRCYLLWVITLHYVCSRCYRPAWSVGDDLSQTDTR